MLRSSLYTMNPAALVGWRKATDTATGRSYYVNNATGATQWHVPLALSAALPEQKKPAKQPRKQAPKKRKADDDSYDPAEGTLAQSKKKPSASASARKPKAKPQQDKPKQARRKFDPMFLLLQAFKAKHGHCKVPTTPKTELSSWQNTIRQNYRQLKKGEPSTLTVDRIVKLTDIGFVFNARPNGFVSFETRIEQCQAFVAEHEHLRIPLHHAQLGGWTQQMRNQYKNKMEGKKVALSDERQQALEEMGFVWLAGKRMPEGVMKNQKPWAERFDEFKEYLQMHGHPHVPQHLEVSQSGGAIQIAVVNSKFPSQSQ